MTGEAFSTPVANSIAIVVDPTHERYGESGSIAFHDWKEYGVVGVAFEDGDKGDFNDGLLETDGQFPQVVIVDSGNQDRLDEIASTLETRRGELSLLRQTADVAGRAATGSAVERKKAFWAIVGGETDES